MRSVPLVVLALLFAASGAQAQVITSPYRYIEQRQSLTLHGGYLDTDTGDFDLAPRSSAMVGAQYAIRLSGPLYGTLGASFLPSSRTVYSAAAAQDPMLTARGEVDAPLVMAEGGVLFHITGPRSWHALAPYAGASVGLVMDLAGTSQLESDQGLAPDQLVDFGPAFAVGLSAGTDWFLTERLSLRAAGRGYLWRFSAPEALTGDDDAEWLRNLGGTLGVAFHF